MQSSPGLVLVSSSLLGHMKEELPFPAPSPTVSWLLCFVLFWSQGFEQPRLTSLYGLEPLTLLLPTLSAGYSWLVLFKRIFRGHQDGLVVKALSKRTWWSEFNPPALGRRESTLKVVLWPQMHVVVYMFACIYTLTMMIAVNKIKKIKLSKLICFYLGKLS